LDNAAFILSSLDTEQLADNLSIPFKALTWLKNEVARCLKQWSESTA